MAELGRKLLSRTGAALLTTTLMIACAGAAAAQKQPLRIVHTADITVGYVAERSLRVSTGQNFWMNGAGAEAGVSFWHGLGSAVNITGATTDHVGQNGAGLSLMTFTAGPRLRFHETGRLSPYGEALFGVGHGFHSIFPAAGGATASATSFAMQLGGGLDVIAGRRFLLRPVDVSYVRTQLPNGTNNTQNTLRIGFSVGLTFGGR